MKRTAAGWSSVTQALPALFVVGGAFLVVIGALASVVYYFNFKPDTDSRAQAETATTAVIAYLPAGGSLAPDSVASTNYSLTLALTTGTQAIDGLQLDLTVKGKVNNLLAKPVAASGLSLAKNTTTAITGGYQTKLLLLPVTAGQPVQLSSQKGIVELQFSAQPNESVILEVKSATSIATLYRQPGSQVLSIPSPVTYQLTGSISPTAGLAPTLQLSFSQQGLSSAGVILPTEVVLKTTGTTLQRFNVQAKSGPGGINNLITPINLSSGDLGKKYQVFVKTPTTLMKMLGELTVVAGQNVAPDSWRTSSLIVGDLENTGAQANIISIADIAKMLSIYTQLTTPVTAQTSQYDVNFDGRIDIADVALVLSNFTALQITGDVP